MIPLQASWRVKEPTRNPPPSSLDGLLEEGSEAIPVRITIVQDDVTTGWDDGALGFEEDAVWFNGRATSFRLAAPDVLPGAYLLSRREAVTAGEALNQGFPLRHPTREVWVRVEILTNNKEDKAQHEARFIQGVQRLRALQESVVPSEYPPLRPRPGLVDPSPVDIRRKRLWRVFIAFGIGAILVGNFSASIEWLSPIQGFVSGTGTAILFFGVLNLLSGPKPLDLLVLRRIAREERENALPLTGLPSSGDEEGA